MKQPYEFFESLLFTKVFKSFRIAVQPTKLLVSFMAITFIFCTGWVMDLSQSVVEVETSKGVYKSELDFYLYKPAAVNRFIETYQEKGERTGVFSTLFDFASENFHSSVNHLFAFNFSGVATDIAEYFSAFLWALKYHLVYCIIFFAIAFTVISFAGGTLCRMAALGFSKGEKPGLSESLLFGWHNFKSFFFAPLVPVGIILLLGLLIFTPGLLGNIPYIGELIVGLLMPVSLLIGSIIVLVSIGAFAGYNLMYPAVAYEKCDSFDAISRAFNYVYSRPFRYVFYSVVAAFFGSICYVFIRFFVFLLMYCTRLFLSLAIFVDSDAAGSKLNTVWPEPTFLKLARPVIDAQLTWSETAGAFLIKLSLLVVLGILLSVIISFFFSANTIIYSLLRYKVDKTPVEDIYTTLSETKDDLNNSSGEPGKLETSGETQE